MNNTGKKYGGRKPGTPNKTTAEIKEALNAFIGTNIDKLQEDFDAIEEPEKRMQLFIKLMNYVVPQQQSINAKIDIEKQLQAMDEEALQMLARMILDQQTQ